jgi:hypothetical protein
MAELLYRTRKTRPEDREAVTIPIATATAAPEIGSIGLPHAIHADRIIGLMLQELAQRNAKLWAAIYAITKGPNVRDGNPRAQAKLEARIKALGVLGTDLQPGKRGCYELRIYSLAGWDPQRDTVIEPGDPIPEKPWICTLFHVVRGEGQCWVRHLSYTWLYLSHHCLSRSAQRWGVRTAGDLSTVIEKLIRVALEYLVLHGLTDPSGDARFDTPPEGVRLPMPEGEGMIVVKKHETREALVIVTVLD